MASERGQQEALPAQGPVQPPDASQPPGSVTESKVDLAEVEQALVELLRCYKGALKFAVAAGAPGDNRARGE
jgi:hypothetical protein